MIPLSNRIQKECARAESRVCRPIKDVECDPVQIIEILKDGRNRDDIGFVPLAAYDLYKYFLIRDRYREARDALYLTCAMWVIRSGDIERKTRLPPYFIPYMDSRDRSDLLTKLGYPGEFARFAGREWRDCVRIYPFVEDRATYRAIIEQVFGKWQAAYESERGLAFFKTWDEGLAYCYPSYAHFLLTAIWLGRFDAVESSLEDFIKWIAWRANVEKKPSYKDLRSRGRRFSKGEDPRRIDYPPVKRETILPLMDGWTKARKEFGPHDACAKEMMSLFYRWFVEEIDSDLNCSMGDMPMEILFSIVMRIDLGVDLDRCKEFARYFMPYLRVFPYIQDKLAALGVTYDEPQYMPIEEIRKYYAPER